MILQKKVCLIGAFAVGKTSLVRRFVHSIFDDKYLTTIGVKIEQCSVALPGEPKVNLVVWDLAGEDRFHQLAMNYVRGAAGYILVADGTRGETLDHALDLHQRVQEAHGRLPHVLVVNKADLKAQWEVESGVLDHLQATGHQLRETSALDGSGVAAAFHDLTRELLDDEG